MMYRTVIPVSTLRQHLEDPTFVIFDCRHDLMKPQAGAQAYAATHIPGARFAHSDSDLAGAKNGKNGRHPLPDPQLFASWLGRNGVSSSTQVVAYDFAGGASATRLWWMLRWLGHDGVAVLDGGWEAWTKAGAPVPALSSALSYFDSYRQARGTANLIQGQRDFFGAHGFERIGEKGDFHGPWAKG